MLPPPLMPWPAIFTVAFITALPFQASPPLAARYALNTADGSVAAQVAPAENTSAIPATAAAAWRMTVTPMQNETSGWTRAPVRYPWCEDRRAPPALAGRSRADPRNASTNRGIDESDGCHSPHARRCTHVHLVTKIRMTVVIRMRTRQDPWRMRRHAVGRTLAGCFVRERGLIMRRTVLFAVTAALGIATAAQAAP